MDCQWCWKVEVNGASVFHRGRIALFHLLSELKLLTEVFYVIGVSSELVRLNQTHLKCKQLALAVPKNNLSLVLNEFSL